jgi:hypothetical protein
VVRRKHRVELAPHCAYEHGVRRIRSAQSRTHCGRSQHPLLFIAEPAAFPGVRIEGAQRDAWLLDPEPALEAGSGDRRYPRYRFHRDGTRHFREGDVRGGQNHAEQVSARSRFRGSEHHRDVAAGDAREHLCVTWVIEAAGEQCGLVDGPRHDSFDRALEREPDGRLYRLAAQGTGISSAAMPPASDRVLHGDADSLRPHEHKLAALADTGVGEPTGVVARAARTISGPMPRGSPMVTASFGRIRYNRTST